MARRRELVALSLIVVFCGSLSFDRLAEGSEKTDALILYPGAKAVWSGIVGETRQLRYHLDVRYPASNVIDRITAQLREADWEPLSYDFLNPGLPPSRLRNWDGGFLEGLNQPETCVHLWAGDWKDASGDIVRYMFRYRHHGCATSDLTDLEVIGVYVPATVARQAQQATEQSKKKLKAN
jgi:hypothetical protein